MKSVEREISGQDAINNVYILGSENERSLLRNVKEILLLTNFERVVRTTEFKTSDLKFIVSVFLFF